MCTGDPSSILSGIASIAGIINKVNDVNQTVQEQDYRAQVAINNAKTAENEALRQRQLGIDESRREKILGFQEANKMAAKNAASGFNVSSETMTYGYNDVLSSAYSNAESIKEAYELNAQSYDDQAKSYYESASLAKENAKNYLLNSALVGLGQASLAASDWYNKRQEEGFPHDMF